MFGFIFSCSITGKHTEVQISTLIKMIFCTTCKIQYYLNRYRLFLHKLWLQRLQYCRRYKKKEVLILLKAFGHKKVARPKTFVNRIVIMVETIQNSHSKIIRARRLLRYVSICTAESVGGLVRLSFQPVYL